MENTKVQSGEAPPQQTASEQEKKRVSDIHVPDQNAALNVMVGFLNVAQQRGVYSVEESAKIWECMQFFLPPGATNPSEQQSKLPTVNEGDESSA
tara:strand:+ start:38 stop:322 length:285 start_codon:yes stop_codon:yes gene_type:complete